MRLTRWAEHNKFEPREIWESGTTLRRGQHHASLYIFRQGRLRTENFRRACSTKQAGAAAAIAARAHYTGCGPGKGQRVVMPTFGTTKVKVKDIAIFFRQFSVMIDAGLPLVQCLEILAANQENPSFQTTLTGVRTTV